MYLANGIIAGFLLFWGLGLGWGADFDLDLEEVADRFGDVGVIGADFPAGE
jgi:hypothetical protein